ncbi:MAG: phenylacetate--CoA ligase family protein [Gemmatimonadaceae bacterium]
MRESLLKRYHNLPPALRSVIATARGGYLRAWRYGPRTEQLCEEALAREQWTQGEWKTWREERLALLLHRAALDVPYYRQHWNERRRRGDRAAVDLLANWPILEKETLRTHAAAFVADDRSRSRMFHDHTSGTSGKSLDLWLSRGTVQAWYALFEARCRHWNGVSRRDRWAMIGGQLVVSVRQNEPPFWVWNASLHQLYLSAYHLAPRHAGGYVEALRKYGVRYIVGYPSAVHALAREVLSQNLRPPALDFVLANAEGVLDQQRCEIEAAFGCPVRETYGMAEIVANASECREGRMHLWPEVGEIETVNGNESSAIGEMGELVCTGLLNLDMPLIRYRVGDRGSLALPDASCRCGRLLPLLSAIDGRIDDVLYTPDGRAVGRLDPVFKSSLPIKEAQIVQDELDLIRIRYVSDESFSAVDAQSLIDRVRDRMGAVRVILEEVDSIPRTNNGKFRAVVSNLSPEERRRAQSR